MCSLVAKSTYANVGVAIAVSKASTSENASIDRVFANFAKQNRTAIRINAQSAYRA